MREISEQEFEDLFFKHTAKALGEKLGVSRTTINNNAKERGLVKGKGYHQRKITITKNKDDK